VSLPPVAAPPLVIKFGGELLEDPTRLAGVAAAVSAITQRPGAAPLLLVHGGGKEIDAALQTAGIEKRQVDGLRITDAATLEVVVAVLAGSVNTRFVAALTAAGVSAVGLTGADGACGRSEPAPPHRSVSGAVVNLGRVGVPSDKADPRLPRALMAAGFVPVVACIGFAADGTLLNVNADTFAGHLAARVGAFRLVIAGTTAGVLDDGGATVPALDPPAIEALIHGRTATAGMIAKLRACEHALSNGVDDVVIVDGRDQRALVAAAVEGAHADATRLRLNASSRS
jgi:acetylglutamate kinase